MAYSSVRSAAAAAICFVLAGASPADAGAVGLAAHRAIYDLMLDRSEDAADLADMSGRIVMEFNGSRCSGYSVALRFVTEIADQDGDLRITDARTETFEEGNGGSFKFTNETFIDETLTEESHGRASRTADGIAVALTKPSKKDFVLDKSVVFPTAQIVQIIEAAQRHQTFLQVDVYDGSEDGETVYATTVVVGSGSTSSLDIGDEVAAGEAGVAGLRHWPVTVSYFDQVGEGEQTPIYVMSFILYENGISRRLKIDYGDFAIVGRLTGLEMLTPAKCP
jgi:EipB-like